MLVLTRREGERVFLRVGDTEIAVTPTLISGNNVKLSFEAPKSVEILREELIEAPPNAVKIFALNTIEGLDG